MLFVTLDTLRRSWSEGRPLDKVMLAMQLCVLLLMIADFTWRVVSWFRRKGRASSLDELMATAETLYSSKPKPADDQATKDEWTKSASLWITAASQFFRKQSRYVREVFERDGNENESWEHDQNTELARVMKIFGYRYSSINRVFRDIK